MALHYQLHTAHFSPLAGRDGSDEQVSESRLHCRMEMDLGLLHEDRGMRRCVEALDDDREDLRYAEADVGELHLFRASRGLHADLVLVAVGRDLANGEGVDEPHPL